MSCSRRAPGPDTTPPTVTSTSPAANATGVATSTQVVATFSEALDPTTVSTQTATLTGAGGTAVAAQVTYDAGTRSVVIQPTSTLSPSTTYTARLAGGSTDPRITDVAGNALVADKVWSFTTAERGPCDDPANEIVAENCRAGNPASEWDITGSGDASIQGYATQISTGQGGTVEFKIDTTAAAYRIDIYRLGYYGGMGARKVATIPSTSVTPRNQPDCIYYADQRNLVDCGNWSVSATWQVPADADVRDLRRPAGAYGHQRRQPHPLHRP